MILVTGATGNNGTEIVKRLAATHVQVRAMVRNPERAGAIALPFVEVVQGDFDRPATLLSALAGVERAFLLTSSSERAQSQRIAFIDAARRSGIVHIGNCRCSALRHTLPDASLGITRRSKRRSKLQASRIRCSGPTISCRAC